MAREMGLKPAPDSELKQKLDEIDALQKSIGPTGTLALSPLLARNRRELWQLHFLKS